MEQQNKILIIAYTVMGILLGTIAVLLIKILIALG